MKILVVTNEADAHASSVIEELYELVGSDAVFRLNTEMLLRKNVTTCLQSTSETQFSLQSSVTDRRVELSEIRSVYFRRPEVVFPVHDTCDPAIKEVVSRESTLFIDWLLSCLDADAYVLSPPQTLRRANSKLLQYVIATRCGFRVPDTLYSNDKGEVRRFAELNPWIAVKTLREAAFVRDEESYSFFTRKVAGEDILRHLESATHVINYLQAYIPKQYELRVTVVRRQVFPVRLESQRAGEKAREDWRRENYANIEHSVEDLPTEVTRSIFKFMDAMQLEFGCFDFIVDTAGKFWFLECNANGQWLWIQEMTGLNIAKAIAQTLVCGRTECVQDA